jgi:HEAT repeat protein
MLMGLIELCLLSLISAQEPTTTGNAAAAHAAMPEPPAATAPAMAAQGQSPVPKAARSPMPPPAPTPGDQTAGKGEPAASDQDPRKALRAQEDAGDAADANALAKLAMSAQADVAARAAWLLGNSKNPTHQAQLPAIATNSPHPEARLQALQAIRVSADVTSTKLAIEILDDDDRRVRTVAVQLLAKLRRPAAIEPLLELLGTSSKLDNHGPATDVQAALLTLADLNASQYLLRMSSAINDGKATGTGEALTYAFQTLSPKLDDKAETTVLVAILGHSETLLRRYAITRLTELDSKTALTALEGRLANESKELRPLIEVAIAQIRHDGKAPPTNNAELAAANAKALWARTVKWWNGLAPTQQALAGSTPISLILLVWMVRRTIRRRTRAQEALDATAWVHPSDEYLDEQDEEYGDYEEDGDYEDGHYVDETDEQPESDTAGWQDDRQETVPANETPENELYR